MFSCKPWRFMGILSLSLYPLFYFICLVFKKWDEIWWIRQCCFTCSPSVESVQRRVSVLDGLQNDFPTVPRLILSRANTGQDPWVPFKDFRVFDLGMWLWMLSPWGNRAKPMQPQGTHHSVGTDTVSGVTGSPSLTQKAQMSWAP